MAPTRGRLDSQGCPLATVVISRADGRARGLKLDALIDTGFTGFCQMPMRSATAIGLVAAGTIDLTYPDGTTRPMPVALGRIRVDDATQDGLIVLSDESEDVLLGVHFLRLTQMTLTFSVHRRRVELS